MPAYMHVCMLMLSVLAMTHLAVSLNSVGKKTHHQMQPLNLELHIGELEETHFCVKHAITDNREGLGPCKIK